jgi:hypothetical protein
MRGAVVFLAAALAVVLPAAAQTSSITIDADPVPIVDAQINGQPVRLEVDLRMGGYMAMSTQAAERLHVRRVPFVGIRVGIEGGSNLIRGRVARPRIVFAGDDARATTGVFAAPVTSRADGVIGAGALPYDVVTIRLQQEQDGARDRSFALDNADSWSPQAPIGGETVRIVFDLSQPASVFNRTAARRFDASGTIVSNGELAERPVILGLRTLMQPVDTALTFDGLALAPAYARTNAPLLGADSDDTVVVEADPDHPPPPQVSVGRQALSRCSSISVDHRSRRLTLRCW